MSQQKLVPVAYIAKLYGGEGEVVLNLLDSFTDEVEMSEPLFVYCDNLAVPLFLNSFKFKGTSKAIASFDDLNTNYRITPFLGSQLYSSGSFIAQDFEVEDDEEFYFEQLIGYVMYDLNSGRKGKIIDYIEHKINPIFTVEMDGIEIMVPACDEIVQDIYTDANVVEALIPDGLFEFYSR